MAEWQVMLIRRPISCYSAHPETAVEDPNGDHPEGTHWIEEEVEVQFPES